MACPGSDNHLCEYLPIMSKTKQITAFAAAILLIARDSFREKSTFYKGVLSGYTIEMCTPPRLQLRTRANGKKYCSFTCADAKGVTELTCRCQHPACQGDKLKA